MPGEYTEPAMGSSGRDYDAPMGSAVSPAVTVVPIRSSMEETYRSLESDDRQIATPPELLVNSYPEYGNDENGSASMTSFKPRVVLPPVSRPQEQPHNPTQAYMPPGRGHDYRSDNRSDYHLGPSPPGFGRIGPNSINEDRGYGAYVPRSSHPAPRHSAIQPPHGYHVQSQGRIRPPPGFESHGHSATEPRSEFEPSRRQIISHPGQSVVDNLTFDTLYTPMQSRGQAMNTGNEHGPGGVYQQPNHRELIEKYRRERHRQEQYERQRQLQLQHQQPHQHPHQHPHQYSYQPLDQRQPAVPPPGGCATSTPNSRGKNGDQYMPTHPLGDKHAKQAKLDEQMKSFDSDDDDMFYPHSN
ncbi:hypothetical protein F4819DRAFT_476230 [Hypoxylon fuscum]|nr:hypothetical protein F4819DRAFT_476230 [Hypoxylon fuscum]